jgi:hypothetical protein
MTISNEQLISRVKAARDRREISLELAMDICEALKLPSAPPAAPGAPSGQAEITVEFTAQFERGLVDQALKDVEALTEGRTDAFYAGISMACEELRHRLGEAWAALPAAGAQAGGDDDTQTSR